LLRAGLSPDRVEGKMSERMLRQVSRYIFISVVLLTVTVASLGITVTAFLSVGGMPLWIDDIVGDIALAGLWGAVLLLICGIALNLRFGGE
jgi:hypothetical protein